MISSSLCSQTFKSLWLFNVFAALFFLIGETTTAGCARLREAGSAGKIVPTSVIGGALTDRQCLAAITASHSRRYLMEGGQGRPDRL